MSANEFKIAGLASRLTERAADDGDAGVVVDAEAAVAELRENYTTWVRSDLAAMRAAFEKAHADRDHGGDHLRALFEVCHNVKAQGGTFGYDLITQVGHSLCNFIRDWRTPSDKDLAVVGVHLTAMTTVIDNEITGSGGEAGAKLMARLETLVAKAADDA